VASNQKAPGTDKPPAVGIIGLGNVLMGDDAFGPYCIKVLEAGYALPEGVSALDAGTPGLDLTPYISGLKSLIVLDTIRAEGMVGELRLYRKEEILRHLPEARVNPHDPGLKEALLTLDFSGCGPEEALLIGAIPKSVSAGTGMSEELKKAVPQAIAAALEEMRRLGFVERAKANPDNPDIWWEGFAGGAPPP
jgi:hydrogenase maturation protease